MSIKKSREMKRTAMEAVISGAAMIQAGMPDVILAGGRAVDADRPNRSRSSWRFLLAGSVQLAR
jgi:acetyl-CoA acetyltransferase